MSTDRPEQSDQPGDVTEDEGPVELGTAVTFAKEKQTRRRKRQVQRHAREQLKASGLESNYADNISVFVPNVRQIPPMRQYLEALWARREFAAELARSDLKGSRSSTNFGRLWGILDPAFTAGVYYLLFTIIREGSRPILFLHILFACILLYQFTTGAMTDGANSITRSAGLMLNSAFPAALLPIASVYHRLLALAPSIIVYVILRFVVSAPSGLGLLFLPLLFFINLVLAVGLALLTATIATFFKDTKNFLSYIARLLFFTTPIIYPASVIPDDLRVYLAWQPIFALFTAYQDALDGIVPSMWGLAQSALWAFGMLIVGAVLFVRHEKEFAGRL